MTLPGVARKLVQRKVADLRAYERNAKDHPEEQIVALCRTIERHGFNAPVLVDPELNVVAGHARLLAAARLGLRTVPTITLEHLTPEQARAYRIADNRVAELGEWNEALLASELEAIRRDGDLDGTGFSDDELAELLESIDEANEGNREIEDTEPGEPPETPVSRRGDVWILGRHRLMCGDSSSSEDVEVLLAGDVPALMATDPPYCVEYTGADRPQNSGKDWSDTYREIEIEDLGEFLRAVLRAVMPRLRKDAGIYIWHAHLQYPAIDQVLAEFGVLRHQPIIWAKPSSTFGYSYYRWAHETCVFGWLQGHKPPHYLENALGTVWEADWEGKARVSGNEHPCQKPLRLFEIPMEQHTEPGGVVFEPFSGSGTQLLAAEKLGRRCRAMELVPAFVDVAVRRWEAATGQVARLDGTDDTLGSLELSRNG